MTLDQYLTDEGVTAAVFGQRLGMSEASVSRIRRGEQNITRDVMRRIIAASGGKITPDGLVFIEAKDVELAGSGPADPAQPAEAAAA